MATARILILSFGHCVCETRHKGDITLLDGRSEFRPHNLGRLVPPPTAYDSPLPPLPSQATLRVNDVPVRLTNFDDFRQVSYGVTRIHMD